MTRQLAAAPSTPSRYSIHDLASLGSVASRAVRFCIKGFRAEDVRVKNKTLEVLWTPSVNTLGTQGRWAFAELTDVYEIESGFQDKVDG